VIISMLLGRHGNQPLDGNHLLADGHPLLGPSKTIRGVFAAVLCTALAAPLFDLGWLQGAGFGLLAMLGDIGSSFTKRRLGLASGHSVPLLDQLPETLLPLWVLQPALGMTLLEMLAAVAVFIVIDLLLSRLLRTLRKP
jgi:CDP-diglyceride synthetase